MKFINNFVKDRGLGFWLSLLSALLAIITAIIYLICYLAISGQQMDRVFSPFTLIFTLIGGLIILVGEYFRLDYVSMLGTICLSFGLANHSVEAAYPLADVGTGVDFFGGNKVLAILFLVLIGLAFLTSATSNFFEHNKVN